MLMPVTGGHQMSADDLACLRDHRELAQINRPVQNKNPSACSLRVSGQGVSRNTSKSPRILRGMTCLGVPNDGGPSDFMVAPLAAFPKPLSASLSYLPKGELLPDPYFSIQLTRFA